MMSSVTAGTRGIPMYTMRLWRRREGRSGGGPMRTPVRVEGRRDREMDCMHALVSNLSEGFMGLDGNESWPCHECTIDSN